MQTYYIFICRIINYKTYTEQECIEYVNTFKRAGKLTNEETANALALIAEVYEVE